MGTTAEMKVVSERRVKLEKVEKSRKGVRGELV